MSMELVAIWGILVRGANGARTMLQRCSHMRPHAYCRYYIIVVQYTARLHAEKLKTFIHRLNGGSFLTVVIHVTAHTQTAAKTLHSAVFAEGHKQIGKHPPRLNTTLGTVAYSQAYTHVDAFHLVRMQRAG